MSYKWIQKEIALQHRIFALILIFVACKSRPTDSELRLANGFDIPDAEYPATTAIYADDRLDSGGPRSCTGTFITKRILITAAHCIHDGIFQFVLQNGIDFEPSIVLRSGDHFENGSAIGLDLGALIFASDATSHTTQIAMNLPQNGSKMTVLGTTGDGIKRRGHVTLDAVKDDQVKSKRIIAYVDNSSATSYEELEAVMHGGDSGGPALVNDELIAVLSGFGQESSGAATRWASLQSDYAKNFIRRVFEIASSPTSLAPETVQPFKEIRISTAEERTQRSKKRAQAVKLIVENRIKLLEGNSQRNIANKQDFEETRLGVAARDRIEMIVKEIEPSISKALSTVSPKGQKLSVALADLNWLGPNKNNVGYQLSDLRLELIKRNPGFSFHNLRSFRMDESKKVLVQSLDAKETRDFLEQSPFDAIIRVSIDNLQQWDAETLEKHDFNIRARVVTLEMDKTILQN